MGQESVIGLARWFWLRVSHGLQSSCWLELQSSEGSTRGRSAFKVTHMVNDTSHFLAGHWLETSVPWPVGLSIGCLLCVLMTWQLISPTVSDPRKREPKTEAAVFYNRIASEVIYLHFCRILLVTVLVSNHCYNKLPQTWWLYVTQIYSSGDQKSKMSQQDCIPFGGPRGESISFLFQLL